MRVMLSKDLQSRIYRIIQEIWEEKQRVTYRDFENKYRKSPIEIVQSQQYISPQTFSRMLQKFLHDHEIMKFKTSTLHTILQNLAHEAISNGITDKKELREHLQDFLKQKKVYSPSRKELNRLIGTCIKRSYTGMTDKRLRSVSTVIGKELSSVGLIETFIELGEFHRYPPVYLGKVGITKYSREYMIMQEIKAQLKTEGIEVRKLLSLQNLHLCKHFIEQQHPSDISRTARVKIAEYVLKYLAARYQDSLDSMIRCFIKCSRLMRFRTNQDYDEKASRESLTFLEKSNEQFKAILDAMEKGKIGDFKRYQPFFETVVQTTGYFQNKTGYYETLATKYKYSRRLSRKLTAFEFVGQDDNSKELIEGLRDVLQFRKFAQPVADIIIQHLSFLNAPEEQLRDRRVFEPLVLVTLADLIANGRITVTNSRRYRNIWLDVPETIQNKGNVDAKIKTMHQELTDQWQNFIKYAQKHPSIYHKGHIRHKRPSSVLSKVEEADRKGKIEAFIGSLQTTEIVDILWKVHELTGLLDTFQLVNPTYHGHILSDEKRQELALVTILARGMNIGLKGIAKAAEGEYTIGQLTNFDENYISIENVEASNRLLIQYWDQQQLGSQWGDGHSCSSDGKVMFSFVNNLLSRFHYRKGRMGVTIYWFVRNDWIANYVQIIGNDEWESWYVIDGLLNSYCDKDVRQSCGDTQAQLLALWGLGTFLDLDIRARFRALRHVKLYTPHPSSSVPFLTDLSPIDWALIKRCLPSIIRLVNAVELRLLPSKPYVSTWNIFDDDGNNIGDGLREVGKVYRTIFILKYLMDLDLQREIQAGCNRAEFWNKFQDAVFWGKGRVVSSNNPYRQYLSILFMMLLMNSIVLYNKAMLGPHAKSELGSIGLIPAFWQHINFLGKYRIR